ncbi:hypothetical protein [Halosegnis sp.]|uniref:hypothetical protein n=1 Tax=Halosegnis sp. TaxID=2864959 RepID=UPI0035D4B3B0
MQPNFVAAPEPALRFPVGLLGAVLATLVMDRVMARLPEGETPPQVASGVLTGAHPDDAPQRLATVVHYLAGGLTGPLFVWLLYAGEFLVGGPTPVTTLSVGVVLLVLMIGFFVGVVLPRSRLRSTRRAPVARDWTLSALAYLFVLVPVVHLGTALL